MFGRDCLCLKERAIAFLDTDRLALKLAPALAAGLLTTGGAVVPRMGERPMRHWVAVALPAAAIAGPLHWEALLLTAQAHALHG